MSAILNSAIFPGEQGGPLEHCIAAKAVAFYEALQPEFVTYQKQVRSNAETMAKCFMEKGYKVVLTALTTTPDAHRPPHQVP